MVQDFVRGPYSRTQYQYSTDRFPTEHSFDGGRYQETPRRWPVKIPQALREHCNIGSQCFFLFVITDDGTPAYFAGPHELPENGVSSFFDTDKFVKCQKCSPAGSALDDDVGLPFDDEYQRHTSGLPYAGLRMPARRRRTQGPESFDDDLFASKTRKRPRASISRRDLDNDEPPAMTTKKALRIGNSNEVWDFYGQRFRSCQQSACKLIAKAWVKVVEPRKQSKHAYTKGEESAPPWWPKPWGPTKEERVRHKEPDHLYKKERVHLLTHILRMVVLPNAEQHPAIRELNITVQSLEEATMDALSTWFADKETPSNALKKPYLKEIFKVAKMEEKYRRGEIDGETDIHVMQDDKTPDGHQSDDEDAARIRDDNEHSTPTATSNRTSPRKESTTPHSMMTGPGSDHGPTGNMQGSQGPPFIGAIPVRGGQQFGSQMLPSGLGSEQHPYAEEPNMTVSAQPSLPSQASVPMSEIMTSPHDHSRRPSLFGSPTEFQAGSGPAGMYAGGWQHSGTTSQANSSMYAFAHHQSQQQHSAPFVAPSGVQQYIGGSFDGMPRTFEPTFEPGPGTMFRSGSVGNVGNLPHATPIPPSPVYSNYMPPENRTLSNSALKLESHIGSRQLH